MRLRRGPAFRRNLTGSKDSYIQITTKIQTLRNIIIKLLQFKTNQPIKCLAYY